MLITYKAQYTSHKTLIWLRVSLTYCTYVLVRGAMIFSFDKSTSLEEGGSEKKNPEMIRGDFKNMKGKNKEIIIAHAPSR